MQVNSIIFQLSFKDYKTSHITELKQLIESQAILINAIAMSSNRQWVKCILSIIWLSLLKIVFNYVYSLCKKSFNVLNDIWTHDVTTLEFYGEFLKELNSKPYTIVIESYLLKSMASINVNLCDKYKVLFFYKGFFIYCMLL